MRRGIPPATTKEGAVDYLDQMHRFCFAVRQLTELDGRSFDSQRCVRIMKRIINLFLGAGVLRDDLL